MKKLNIILMALVALTTLNLSSCKDDDLGTTICDICIVCRTLAQIWTTT